MAKITIGPQEIPSALLDGYKKSLTEEMPSTAVRKRYPWRLPKMQNDNPAVSISQQDNREIFKRCVACFNDQPTEGGAEPPDVGPRNRAWWYEAAVESGLWYYDYFIKTTMDTYIAKESPVWCNLGLGELNFVGSIFPNSNYYHSPYTYFGKIQLQGPDLDRWNYIKNDTINGTKLYVCPYGYDGGSGPLPQGYFIDLEIYKVNDDWNPHTITWNNKPALGELITTAILPYTPTIWQIIPTTNFPRICIRPATWKKYGIRVYTYEHYSPLGVNAHFIP